MGSFEGASKIDRAVAVEKWAVADGTVRHRLKDGSQAPKENASADFADGADEYKCWREVNTSTEVTDAPAGRQAGAGTSRVVGISRAVASAICEICG